MNMRTRILLFFLATSLFVTFGCKDDPEPSCSDVINELGINQLQILGSHNSYRLRTYDPILQFLYANPQILPGGFNPDDWDYTHLPLDVQFDQYGIRSVELDVYNDPNGGLFYYRMGNAVLGLDPASGEPALLEPGLKILHVPDVDYQTNYLTFKVALNAVKNWSDMHPDHLPITILVEPKEDDLSALGPPFNTVIPFDKASLETIDQEIKDVFGSDLKNVITPDEVRGNYSTLNEAIKNGKWPTVGDSRGKIVFVMIPSADERFDYLEGHTTLEDRAMFVFSIAGSPEAAFLSYEDPSSQVAEIQSRVMEGYFVRTRADADTKEARSGNTTRRDAAFNSGAQIISTDYYRPDPRSDTSSVWTKYFVQLPGDAPAIMNPVNGRFDEYSGCPIEEN